MPYRKIEPKLWDDENLADLDVTHKLVWLYILTGPHTTSLPGLWVVGPASMAEGLRLPVATVVTCLNTLRTRGRIDWDPVARLLRVRNAPRHNCAENKGQVISWWNQWVDLPDCKLKYAHIDSIREGALAPRPREAWHETFGNVDIQSELSRFANEIRTRSERDPNLAPVSLSGSDQDLSSGSQIPSMHSHPASARVATSGPDTTRSPGETAASPAADAQCQLLAGGEPIAPTSEPKTRHAKSTSAPGKRGPSHKVSLPTGWAPNGHAFDVGAVEGYARAAVEAQAERFRGDAIAHGRRYVDWHHAFYNWLRNQKNYERGSPRARDPPRGQQPGAIPGWTPQEPTNIEDFK